MHMAHGTNVHGFIPNSITANQSILLSRFFQEQYLLIFLLMSSVKFAGASWHVLRNHPKFIQTSSLLHQTAFYCFILPHMIT